MLLRSSPPDSATAAPGARHRGRRRREAFTLQVEPLERRTLLAAGSIEFSTPAFTAADTAGTVPIVLTRTGGSSGAVSVSFATGDGTAVAGTDYDTLKGTVTADHACMAYIPACRNQP